MIKVLPALLLTATLACTTAFGQTAQVPASVPIEPEALRALNGGVVDQVRRMETQQGVFLLVVHRENYDASSELTLLQRFAGGYTTVFTTEWFFTGDEPPSFDLVDSNRDGVPEVYWMTTMPAAFFLFERHYLYEPVSKKTLEVEVFFSGEYPGTPSVDALVLDPKMAAFRNVLEAKVAQSKYLKDPRTPEQQIRDRWNDEWWARHSKLGTGPDESSSLIVSKMEAPLSDVRCSLKHVQVGTPVTLAGRTYYNLGRYGVIELDTAAKKCSLIIGGNQFDNLNIQKVNNKVIVETNVMNFITTHEFDPVARRLSVKQEMK